MRLEDRHNQRMSQPLNATTLWQLSRVGQPVPCPGGEQAVVPVTNYDLDTNEGVTTLHLVNAAGGSRQLTTRESSHPSVSPDGERVAFVRPDDAGVGQLHVMALDGGEAERVTDFPLGVGESRWLPDGSGLVATAALLRDHLSFEATRAEAERREGDPVSAIATEDRVYRYWKRWLAQGKVHHLVHVDLATGSAVDLTPDLNLLLASDADPTGTFDISPDGKTVAYSAEVARDGRPWLQFAIHTVSIDDGNTARLTEDLPAQQVRPRFSPDGQFIVYGVQLEPAYYADRVRLVRHDLAGGSSSVLTEDWDRSASGWEFVDDATLVTAAEDEGAVHLFAVELADPRPQRLTASPGSWHGPRPAGDAIWCRHESASSPAEVAIVGAGNATVVSSVNGDRLAEVDLGDTEIIHVAGSDGRDIEVKLVFPPGFDRTQKWPLLHNVHGGPHGIVGDDWHWRWNTQAFAAAGYVVASVNFHGSTSWGEDFTGSIRGAWGDKTTFDVMTATDALVATGYIDEDRMAVAGGSYGGYLVTWITAQTDRFKASVCHAGVTDLLGQWASDVTEGREKAVGGLPWEDMESVSRWSPLAHTHDISTPTLVVHGELDYRVVVTQGLALYGILQHKGVPARLVYFPDEGHWIETPANSIRWYAEVLDWLQRWV